MYVPRVTGTGASGNQQPHGCHTHNSISLGGRKPQLALLPRHVETSSTTPACAAKDKKQSVMARYHWLGMGRFTHYPHGNQIPSPLEETASHEF